MSQTAQEFFDQYLAEKAALYQAYKQMSAPVDAKFFSVEYLKRIEEWNKDREPERLERAEVFGPTARMFTLQRAAKREMRHRYQLRLVGEKWEIHTLEFECFACRRKGHQTNSECKFCHGEGWMEVFKVQS